jgi:hypothetical protein
MKLKILLCLGLTCTLHAKEKQATPAIDQQPRVQIALLLDTSNSMDGLITQAKTQLWKVVNSFADAKCDGSKPRVEVALYEYGNNTLSAETNYIRQIQPFTRDLDEVSKQLFALSTNGGEEYCGAVIQRSLADLQWSKHQKSYKVIFIAGNEPFTQGPINAHKACSDSTNKGITINTIHCGSRSDGVAGKWHDGAALAGGKFLTINQDQAVAHIETPQDAKIAELNLSLNRTYIPYGHHGAAGKQKQEMADSQARANSKSGAYLHRNVTKASKLYSNSSWDLVDAFQEDQIEIDKLDRNHLPAEWKNLTDQQVEAKIKEVTAKRTAIQKSIKELNKQRLAYIAQEHKKQAAQNTLDQAMVNTTRLQAKAKGYVFTE